MSATRSNAFRLSLRARSITAVARATPTRAKARGSLKDEAKVNAKSKAKAEDEEAMIRRTRIETGARTRTSPGETPILHQGGSLSPLGGSKTRGLRRVPRRKFNENKELSVATKMGTSLTPANVPASCAWRENCATRGLT